MENWKQVFKVYSANNDFVESQNLFFSSSIVKPKGWKYDHIGFLTINNKFIQMSGHKYGNGIYITNKQTDDPKFKSDAYNTMPLSKIVRVPLYDTFDSENCSEFVFKVLQINGMNDYSNDQLNSFLISGF